MGKVCMLGFLLVSMVFALYAGGQKEQPQSPTPAVQPALANQTSPFFTGTGGKGISLAILAPRATGLTDNQGYIPLVVQGEFVSNFSGYSAISVMDRENMDNVYAELLSGYYADDDEAGLDLGHLTATDYILNGSITRTATGYALQMQIVKTADKMTAASYSGTCTFAELDNLTGVRLASLDLLQKMGITLTAQAQTELSRPATTNRANAQTATAQGLAAERNGTVVEALTYYYQAAALDPSLLEAANRASIISNVITGGNLGENIRSDIQRRNEWVKILGEASEYFKNHLPFEIHYTNKLTAGTTNYTKETTPLSFDVWIVPDMEVYKVIRDIRQGLDKTGTARTWELNDWPLNRRIATFYDSFGTFNSDDRRNIPYADKTFNIQFTLSNDSGRTIGTATSRINVRDDGIIENGILRMPYFAKATVTFSVNANDITDNLNLYLSTVNGIDVLANQNYVKIVTSESASPFRNISGYTSPQVVIDDLRLQPDYGGVRIVEGINGKRLSFTNIPNTLGPWNVVSVNLSLFSSFFPNMIIIPENVMVINNFVQDDGFNDFFNSNGKKPGIYVKKYSTYRGSEEFYNGSAIYLGWSYYAQSVLNSTSYIGAEVSSDQYQGLKVVRVLNNSPASKGGIREGDRITHFNNTQLVNVNHFTLMVREQSPGDRVPVTIIRNSKTRILNVTIGTKPEQ